MKWQPIQTAPKDGDVFVAYWPNAPEYDCPPLVRPTFWCNLSKRWDAIRFGNDKIWLFPGDERWPTIWQPFPEPPENDQ